VKFYNFLYERIHHLQKDLVLRMGNLCSSERLEKPLWSSAGSRMVIPSQYHVKNEEPRKLLNLEEKQSLKHCIIAKTLSSYPRLGNIFLLWKQDEFIPKPELHQLFEILEAMLIDLSHKKYDLKNLYYILQFSGQDLEQFFIQDMMGTTLWSRENFARLVKNNFTSELCLMRLSLPVCAINYCYPEIIQDSDVDNINWSRIDPSAHQVGDRLKTLRRENMQLRKEIIKATMDGLYEFWDVDREVAKTILLFTNVTLMKSLGMKGR